jgi:TolB-like protein/Tfp pilus assembly protein PilF
VEVQPEYADSWAMLSLICKEEFTHELNLRPDPLGRAMAAALRAVEAAPSNHLAFHALAMAQYFLGDRPAFRIAAQRALELNPMDGFSLAFLSSFIAYDGDWENGCKLSAKARGLNPNHPGWYWFVPCFDAYRNGDYRLSLEFARKVNMPSLWRTCAVMGAAYGQLGDIESARIPLQTLLARRPNFQADARKDLAIFWGPDIVESLIDGLRKAGLDIPDTQSTATARAASGAVRSADSKTPFIAVLPFANMSADKDQEYFSDGLAEEIINLLAKIPGLKIIARTSAFAFRSKEIDIRRIAEALGVTHVLEGSVRRTETRLRVTGQLIDAADGTHLWSERYDREMSDIFALQDEIATAIARALRVKLSPEAIPSRYEPNLNAYEAYLKAKYQQGKATPESLELAKQYHERAIQLDPAFALARTEVGFYWVAMAMFGRYPSDKASLAARAEAEQALQIDPVLPDAHALLGYLAAVFELDWTKAEKYFAFPGAKQVGTSITQPLYGWFQYLRGNVAEAIALVERAIEQDPFDVWSRMNFHAYLQAADREQEALEQLEKVLELDPNQVLAIVSRAMILADQGKLQEAVESARRAYSIGQWAPETTAVLAALLYRGEYYEEAQSVAKKLGSGGMPGDARALALFHLLRGEVDEGADWVERAIHEGDLAMRTVYIRFVACKQLRASRRWPKIAKMINLPQAPGAPLPNT